MIRLIESGLYRRAIINKDSFITRAKDKKAAKGGKQAEKKERVKIDVSDAPKGLNMERVVYFWNRFGKKPEDTPSDITIPWKEGEEPAWIEELKEPYETVISPVDQINPKKRGYKFIWKETRRMHIRDNNAELGTKDFTILKKHKKKISP